MKPTKCRTKACRGRLLASRHSVYCSKCDARRWKEMHPVNYHFAKLRNRAKERGHKFTLTKEKFAELWNGGLAKNHGKTAFSLCVDRIDPAGGYRDDNVRLLTLSENSRRQFVPFFKNKAAEEEAIRQAEAEVRAAYPPPQT